MSLTRKTKKKVDIQLTRTQSNNDVNPIMFDENHQGELYRVDDVTCIITYDFCINSERVTRTLKLCDSTLTITDSGNGYSTSRFHENEWEACFYNLNSNQLVYRNLTKKLNFALNEQGGLIDVLYELWSGDTHLGFYSYEYYIKEANQ